MVRSPDRFSSSKSAPLSTGQATTRKAGLGQWAAVVLLLAAGPALYGAGLSAASNADGRPLAGTVCFDPAADGHFAPRRLISAAAMATGSVLLVFLVPWLLGTLALRRIHSRRATAASWSLAANSAALVLVCLLLRSTTGLHRISFLVAWLTWSVVLLPAAGGATNVLPEIRSLWRRWGSGMMIGAAVVVVAIVLFSGEHFVQCFNGDGTEFCELARSLRHHFLPYWDLEAAGHFGTFVANPTIINSYWTLALQLLLGAGELSTRLPCWVWWLGVFAISLRMVQGETARGAWRPAVPLALAMFLVSLWYTFYVGYYPYMADPANPAVPDALFTLLLLLGLACLRCGDCAGWVVSMILASLVFYAGGVMLLLLGAAAWVWQPVPRRRIAPAFLIGLLVLAGITGGYLVVGWLEGSLPGWWKTLGREWFRKYGTPGRHGDLHLWFVAYFLLGCGAVPAIALLRAFGRNSAGRDGAWERTAATVTFAYLLIILGSGHKNLHYLGPLLPIPLILWLKRPLGKAPLAFPSQRHEDAAAHRRRSASPFGGTKLCPTNGDLWAALGLALCIVHSWPVSRPVFTLNRRLGAETTFQTDSYEEACRWARIAQALYRERHLGWQIGEHTWASYSQRDAQPTALRPLVVTKRKRPSKDHQCVFESDEGVKLYCQGPRWFPGPRPEAGADRCAWMFLPIAIAPQPREKARTE